LEGNGDRTWRIIEADFRQRVCISSPLFNRAWIVQERLLTRRVLHFGKDQVFWECRTDNYCEMFPDGLPALLRDSSTYLSKFIYDDFKSAAGSHDMRCGRLQHVRDRDSTDKIDAFWERLVTRYSRYALTKGTDKLVALAGMVQNMWQLQSANAGHQCDVSCRYVEVPPIASTALETRRSRGRATSGISRSELAVSFSGRNGDMVQSAMEVRLRVDRRSALCRSSDVWRYFRAC
jgi:hypothetical protein